MKARSSSSDNSSAKQLREELIGSQSKGLGTAESVPGHLVDVGHQQLARTCINDSIDLVSRPRGVQNLTISC